MKKEVYSVLLNEKFRREFLNKAILKFKNQTALAKYLSSKIKNRKIVRENIKEWLKGKHDYGWDILIPINVIKELCVINFQNLNSVLNNAIKFNPPWEDPNKKQLLIKIKEIKILRKNNKIYLDLTTALPEKTLEAQRSKKKLPLFTKLNKDVIELWSEACWKKSKIKLRKFLELNDLFFIGSAIFTSEGTTKINNSYNGSISIANSEPSLINIFLRWLNSFLIDYKPTYNIEYNGRDFNKNKLKSFWINNLIKNNISPLRIRPRENYGSRLINNFGVLHVRIDVTVLKPFLINLLNISKKMIFNNKEWCIAYLKGLLASEGSVYTKRSLKSVSIGAINLEERRFIKKLLKKLGLKFHEGKNQIMIADWGSFYKLFKYNAFEISQVNNYSKKERFLKGFKNHEKTQKLIKLLPFKKKKFTANDWQKYYNLKFYITSHKYLNSLIKEKILKFKFLKNKKYFYINHYKLEELNSIWNL